MNEQKTHEFLQIFRTFDHIEYHLVTCNGRTYSRKCAVDVTRPSFRKCFSFFTFETKLLNSEHDYFKGTFFFQSQDHALQFFWGKTTTQKTRLSADWRKVWQPKWLSVDLKMSPSMFTARAKMYQASEGSCRWVTIACRGLFLHGWEVWNMFLPAEFCFGGRKDKLASTLFNYCSSWLKTHLYPRGMLSIFVVGVIRLTPDSTPFPDWLQWAVNVIPQLPVLWVIRNEPTIHEIHTTQVVLFFEVFIPHFTKLISGEISKCQWWQNFFCSTKYVGGDLLQNLLFSIFLDTERNHPELLLYLSFWKTD